jgi:hypothetical protein
MLTPDEIERAKQVPIGSVAHLSLNCRGHELLGPCPWCGQGEDRFWVNVPKNIWGNRCGCHPEEGADGIEFAKSWFKCEFAEAVERLNGGLNGHPVADKVKILKGWRHGLRR